MSDLISRKAMLKKMRSRRNIFCINQIDFKALSQNEKARVDEIDNCIADLINAPSAEPEPKKGEWISHENYVECSKCHCFTSVGFNYCPHCGAEMINEDFYMKLEGAEHE